MQPALCPVHSTQSPHLSYERCCCKTPNFPRYRSGVPLEKGAGFHHLVKDNRGFQNASGSFPLHRSCWSWGEQQSPSRHSPHRPLHLLAISPSWETPCHLQHASKSPAQRLWLAHQPPAFPPKGQSPALLDEAGGSALQAQGHCPPTVPPLVRSCTVSPPPHTHCPSTSRCTRTMGAFYFSPYLAPRRHRCMGDSGARPCLLSSCIMEP